MLSFVSFGRNVSLSFGFAVYSKLHTLLFNTSQILEIGTRCDKVSEKSHRGTMLISLVKLLRPHRARAKGVPDDHCLHQIFLDCSLIYEA